MVTLTNHIKPNVQYLHVHECIPIIHCHGTKLRFLAVHSTPSVITFASSIFYITKSMTIAIVCARVDAVTFVFQSIIPLIHEANVTLAIIGRYTLSIVAILAVWLADASVPLINLCETSVTFADVRCYAGSIVAGIADGLATSFYMFLVTHVTGALVRRRTGTVPAIELADRFAGECIFITDRFVAIVALARARCYARSVNTTRLFAHRFASIQGST